MKYTAMMLMLAMLGCGKTQTQVYPPHPVIHEDNTNITKQCPDHQDVYEEAHIIYQRRVDNGDPETSTKEQQDKDWYDAEKYITAKCKHQGSK